MRNQQQTLTNIIQTFFFGGGIIYHWLFCFSTCSYSCNNLWWRHFLGTSDKLEIHWYQHQQVAPFMWSTKPTTELLPSSSTFWIVVSMEIVILITRKFCFRPDFFYNSKWYKHKDGKNAVLFLKTHSQTQPNGFKTIIFLKLSQEISGFV